MRPVMQSSIPGRIRVGIQELYNNDALSKAVSFQLLSIPGIRAAEANPFTGKLLVQFDSGQIEVRTILDILQGLAIGDVLPMAMDPKRCRPAQLPLKGLLAGIGFGALVIKHSATGFMPLAQNESILNMAALVTAAAGYPILRRGIKEALHKGPIDSEMVLTGASFLFFILRESTAGLLAVFMLSMAAHSYFCAVKHSNDELKRLAVGKGSYKLADEEQSTSVVPAFMLKAGDIILLNEQDILPLNARILEGRGLFSERLLRGHTQTTEFADGDILPAGTLLLKAEGHVRVQLEVTAGYGKNPMKDSEIPRQDRAWSKRMTWLSMLLSGTSYLITGDITRSLAMLLVACPSGIEHAHPLAALHAVSAASSRGIIIKNEKAFLKAWNAQAAVLDKTGTVSTGNPRVSDILPINPIYSPMDILRFAAQGELGTRHPFGIAIEARAQAEGISVDSKALIHIEGGSGGVLYKTEGNTVIIGNTKWLRSHNINLFELKGLQSDLKKESAVLVAVDGRLAGALRIEDSLKPEAVAFTSALKERGLLHLHIVSGDAEAVTRAAASALGVKYSYSGQMPDDKAKLIQRLKKKEKVVMIGDGINDLPALNEADCGIVLAGRRSEAGLYGGDAVVLGDGFDRIEDFIDLSRVTAEIALQNECIAVAGNLLGFVLTWAGWLSPYHASLYHNGNIILLIANAYRIIYIVKNTGQLRPKDSDESIGTLVCSLLKTIQKGRMLYGARNP